MFSADLRFLDASLLHHFRLFPLRIVRIMYLLITLVIKMGTAKLDSLMSNSELTHLSDAQFAFVGRRTIEKRNYSLCLVWRNF